MLLDKVVESMLLSGMNNGILIPAKFYYQNDENVVLECAIDIENELYEERKFPVHMFEGIDFQTTRFFWLVVSYSTNTMSLEIRSGDQLLLKKYFPKQDFTVFIDLDFNTNQKRTIDARLEGARYKGIKIEDLTDAEFEEFNSQALEFIKMEWSRIMLSKQIIVTPSPLTDYFFSLLKEEEIEEYLEFINKTNYFRYE